MKIAFVADPLADFKVAKDSTYAMMTEAAGDRKSTRLNSSH